MVINFVSIIHNAGFNPKWISPQRVPGQPDFEILLNPGDSHEDAKKRMDAEFALKGFSDYSCKMIDRYSSLVKNETLTVQNDPELTDISFFDTIKAKMLVLNKCFNIVLKNLPKKVTYLTLTNSNLFTIEGLQEMTQLLELDLTNNISSPFSHFLTFKASKG